MLRVLTMIEDKLAKHYQAAALPAGHPVREAIDELRRLRADAARYRWLADRMVHVGHPAGSGWTLDEVLVSNDADLDETVDAMAKEQICAVAKSGQIPGAKTPDTDADPCPRKMAAQWRDASMQALADLSKMRLRVLRQDAVMRQARQDAVMRQARQDAVMRQALEALEERYIGALRDNALDALRAALGEK